MPTRPRALEATRSEADDEGYRWRFAGLTIFLLVPVGVGLLTTLPAVHPTIRFLFAYTPDRLVHGALWTLPLSAFITAQPRALGPNTIVPFVALVPYVLLFGLGRALRAFVIGHVVATLAAAMVISIGAVAGAHEAVRLSHVVDMGVSAGLAAAGGGVAIALFRTRRRAVAFVVVGTLFLFFTHRIFVESPARLLADCEHLVAMATGAVVEWRWGRTRGLRCSTSD